MVLAQQHSDPPRLDVEAIRRDFPALSLTPYGKPLVYLDSAASAQKPEAVIEAEARCYRESYANVHRGVHYLSTKATAAYEDARRNVARFMGAGEPSEIIWMDTPHRIQDDADLMVEATEVVFEWLRDRDWLQN